jgi:polyisoprenoid-binding protein YceI
MQQKRTILMGFLVVIVIAGGLWLYNFVLGATEEASAPISSIPLELTGAPTVEPEPTAVLATAVPDEPEPTAEPEIEPTATAEPTPLPEPTAPPTGPVIFEISQADSEVRFILDELLRGDPTTVIGASDQVAGQIAVDLSDLSTAQLGIIRINARTLETDNNFRNRAIRNRILQTDDYEFITFAPTALTGLPDSAAVGETVSFQIVGDLTIRDITQEATFEAEVTAVSATQLTGTAVTTVQRADFELVIPEVEGVADVDEAVILEIDFTALVVE